ncbi:methionyl-tRNA formyltransferase [Microbacterium azadirachtae]|uniref:Methionyl-tRNA formyltransferase n=1 Tax=Microbacterium azadirachtae TaxID=582680 RepID=A0A1I6FYK2_9MICO|nr:methionyl-tRNA formyltransferase [Microbacterium azadirachtae]SFR34986.1 methionyl-tRNA formyltransferase [Microbacterium azadirachtae]
MRLVFAGTPAAAVPTLRLLAAQHEIVAVVTRPDAPLGRKRILTPSPVAQEANALGLPVIKAARLDDEATARVAALRPELGVIVAYGGLVREPLLSTPVHGWINLHFSLLPAWRGAAPVQRALIAGDAELGATVFQLVPELDAGDVHAERVFAVPDDATADVVLASLAVDGAGLTAEAVAAIADGSARPRAQHGEVTHAAKLGLADGLLSWHEPADAVFARYRGVTSEPGAHTTIDGAPLKVRELARAQDADPLPPGELRGVKGGVLVGTGSDPLLLVQVQPAGKAAMAAADWFRGLRVPDGETVRLGDDERGEAR